MNEDLSRLVAGIIAKAKAGEDLSPGISRVRAAVKEVIDGPDTVFGKFRALVESFREELPGEKQRYQTAIKALSATSKLGRQEIAAAISDQLEELAVLQHRMLSALPRAKEPTEMAARSRKIRNEISVLREKIAQLEKEEKEISGSAVREEGTAVVEQALKHMFADFGAEMTAVIQKVEELAVENAEAQPVSSPRTQDEVQSKKRELRADMIFPDLTTAAEPMQTLEKSVRKKDPDAPPNSELKQKCSMCGGQMDYYTAAAKWQCYSCGFEYFTKKETAARPVPAVERQEAADRGESKALVDIVPLTEPLFDQPSTTRSSPGYWGAKTSMPKRPPVVKKTCPACGKKMHSYGPGKGWQCPECGYERRI